VKTKIIAELGGQISEGHRHSPVLVDVPKHLPFMQRSVDRNANSASFWLFGNHMWFSNGWFAPAVRRPEPLKIPTPFLGTPKSTRSLSAGSRGNFR